MKRVCIGILAHVDAGKTTLSEQILLLSGAIRKKGSVDSGTAHTDTLPVEQRRGISVKSSCVAFTWKDTQVNLIDTPGHVDFSAEVERSFWALDAAVLVVCGVEGVQPQTEALFAALRAKKLPCIFFINKLDREGADANRVAAQIRRMLSQSACLVQDEDQVADVLCAGDDELMERYLSGETLDPALVHRRLGELTQSCGAYPILCGSALREEGVGALLDAVADWLPPPPPTQDTLCGVAFAAAQDKMLGRGVYVRLFSGRLSPRMAITLPAGTDPLTGEEKFVQPKITQMRSVSGAPAESLGAGDVGLVYGLGDIAIGQVIGEAALLPRPVETGKLRTPLITVQVIPDKTENMPALREACRILSGEDTLLEASYIRSQGELHMHVMGTIQLEILEETLLTRFGLPVHFGKPAILYKETISSAATGFVAYTMPKPCWAVMEFCIEPAPRGSGVTFESQCHVRDILGRYQNQVRQALPLALAQGRLGWPVTDVHITLMGGSHHQFHTHPLDFIVATPMGIQDGLRRGGSTLLEPMLEIRFLIPPECVGRVMSDVVSMRGETLAAEPSEERTCLTALVPAATSLDYSTTLATVTGGRGVMSVRLHSYRDCPLELGATARRRNVDPLDESRYILAARSALEGGIFDIG